MKPITSLFLAVGLLCFGINSHAQNVVTVTNYVTVTNIVITGTGVNTNTAPDKTSWELTFGGSGYSDLKTRNHQVGLDVSLEASPFSWNRNIWIGGEQSMTVDSGFAGFSDVFAEYAFDIYKSKVYLNPGWDVRETYATEGESVFGTGPHVSLQYFFFDTTFVYGQANYLFESEGDNDLLYSAGFGITF
jgi:hypothetical protein